MIQSPVSSDIVTLEFISWDQWVAYHLYLHAWAEGHWPYFPQPQPLLILEIQTHVLPMLSSLNGAYANTIRFRFVQLAPLPGVLETFYLPFLHVSRADE